MSSMGLAILGGFTAAALVGVVLLMKGAPSKDAKQSDFSTVYEPPHGGGKKKNKTKRKNIKI